MQTDDYIIETIYNLVKENPEIIEQDKADDYAIFDLACSFHEAGLRCLQDVVVENKTMTATVPAIVNFALAAELYIKARLKSLKIERRVHKLDELFGLLDQPFKDEVIRSYQALAERNLKQFYEDTKLFTNAFVDWRYLYEKIEVGISVSRLISFVKSLHFAAMVTESKWVLEDSYTNIRLNTKDLPITRHVISFGKGVMLRAQLRS